MTQDICNDKYYRGDGGTNPGSFPAEKQSPSVIIISISCCCRSSVFQESRQKVVVPRGKLGPYL